MQKLLKVLGLSLLLLSLAIAAVAQTETGQISGTVKDKSGAVVPNAKVTLVAVETNVTRTAVTSAAGLYNFPALKPTTYKVTVEATGFQKYERQVTVNVATNVDVSAQLAIGSSSTVVEVSAASADVSVNTENQTLSTVITSSQLDQLPTTADRDPYALVSLAGNVGEDDNSGRGAGFSINGSRSSSTNILLDGAENVNTFTAGVGQPVPLDSVQEFSVLTSNFGAEFGRASGGVVNLVTKSGTNQFHGSVYEFNRISALASNTFYNVENNVEKGKFTRNNFGFAVGGPVIKNKLFFFDNLEWVRVRSNGQNFSSIISEDSYHLLNQASQDFFTAYGKRRDDVKVLSTGPCNSGTAAGSTLNCDYVNYAAPSDAGGGTPQNTWNEVGKVDWNISGKTTLTGRYAGYHYNSLPGSLNNSVYDGYDTGENIFSQNVTLALTHIYTPNLVSTTKVVYNRIFDLQPLASAPIGPTIYTNSNLSPTPGNGQSLIFPGYSQYTPGNSIPFGGPQNLYQLYHDVSISKGKHQLKAGAQFIQLRDNRTFGAYENAVETLGKTYAGGLANLISGNIYQFSSAVNPQGKYPCYKDTSGNTIVNADCTLNLPVDKPSFGRNYQYNDAALYIQDAWKVTSRLTLNAGLRWEYYGVQHNSDPSLDSNFVLGSGATIFDQIRHGSVKLRRDGGVFWKPDYKDFGPRVGFAWDPFGKGTTSIRGGYSIGYERNFGNVTFNAIQNPPNYGVIALTAGSDVASMPVYTDNKGPLAGGGTKALPQVSQRAINQNLKSAYSETWNLAVEHTIFTNAIVNLEYAGSRGIHLYDISNLNLAGSGANYLGDPYPGSRTNLQYTAMNYRSDGGYSRYNALVAGFKANNLAKSGVTLSANYQWAHSLDNLSSTFTDGDAASYGTGYLDAFNPKLNYGNSDFDIRHRFVLSATWELPWAKNATNKAARYALGGWVLGGVFNAHSGDPFTIWDCNNYNGTTCPFYVPGSTKVAHSGSPKSNGDGTFNYISIPLDPNPSPYVFDNDGNGVTNIPYNSGNALGLPTCTGLLHVGCTYTQTAGTSVGARNQFKSPSIWNSDLQILKNFKFSEKFGVQFRAEMYNFLNHKNQYIYGANLDVSAFSADTGNSIQTVKGGKNHAPGYPTDEHRAIDLGLKVTF